jgi:hypothetical protein
MVAHDTTSRGCATRSGGAVRALTLSFPGHDGLGSEVV